MIADTKLFDLSLNLDYVTLVSCQFYFYVVNVLSVC